MNLLLNLIIAQKNHPTLRRDGLVGKMRVTLNYKTNNFASVLRIKFRTRNRRENTKPN